MLESYTGDGGQEEDVDYDLPRSHQRSIGISVGTGDPMV